MSQEYRVPDLGATGPLPNNRLNAVEFGDFGRDGCWVFPTIVWRGGRKVVSHLSTPREQRCVDGRMVNFLPTPHVLRRTQRFGRQRRGRYPLVSLKVLPDHLLPAIPGDVTSGYIQPSLERLSEF